MTEAHDERRERLLNAATGLFLRNGYDAVSIDDVIAEAGGSKREIYRLFGGKQGLFEAVVRAHCANTLGALADFDPAGLPPPAALQEFGRRLVAAVTREEAVQLCRLVIASAQRFPWLAETFWAAGPARAHAVLAAYLRSAAATVSLPVEDPDEAAVLLHQMLIAEIHLPLLLEIRDPPSAQWIARKVASLIPVFLGSRPSAGSGSKLHAGGQPDQPQTISPRSAAAHLPARIGGSGRRPRQST